MKILALCGSGLGSSFMLELNISNVLKELNLNDIEVSHTSLTEAQNDMADYFVIGRDLEGSTTHLDKVLVLKNIMDKNELKEVLKSEFGEE